MMDFGETEVYAVRPLDFKKNIPIYIKPDEYTTNYEIIAGHLVDSIKKTGENPFINEKLWREMEDPTLKAIKRYAYSGAFILDVGVGMGRLLELFPEMQRYGIDVSLRMLEIAKNKGINVCCAYAESMPYKSEIFDIVVCTDLLEHVLDLNQACKNILRVLKPDGVLIVRVPYKENLNGYVNGKNYKYVHLRSFDENSIKLLFEKVFKCEIVTTDYVGYQPDWSRLKEIYRIENMNDKVLPKKDNRKILAYIILLYLRIKEDKYELQKKIFSFFARQSNNRDFVFELLEIAKTFNFTLYKQLIDQLSIVKPIFYKDYLRLAFNPIEINVVFKKRKG